MTTQEVMTASRNKYNSVGDTFYSDAEIYDLIYEACLEFANECFSIIEATYTTTTVASTQEYAKPSLTIGISRVTYNGQKLQKIDMRDDDSLTLLNQSTTATGTPQYYYEWGDSIFLRPIPDAAQSLKIFSYNEPQAVTSTSTLEIPTQFHRDLTNFVVSELCAKDENTNMAAFYDNKWKQGIARAKKYLQKKKRGDSFATVKNEDTLPVTFLGGI